MYTPTRPLGHTGPAMGSVRAQHGNVGVCVCWGGGGGGTYRTGGGGGAVHTVMGGGGGAGVGTLHL